MGESEPEENYGLEFPRTGVGLLVRGETLARFRNQDDRPVRYVLRTSERHKYGNLGRSTEKASLNDPLGQEEVEEAMFVRSIAGAAVHVCTSMNPHHDISQ